MILRVGPTTNAVRPWRSGPAFTLIELILVMALLIIVIATVAPALSNFFHGRNLDAEARRLLSLTRLAQSRAVSEGAPMRLWIDAQQRTYGLQAEYGGTTPDNSAKIYKLDPALAIEVVRNSNFRTVQRSTAGVARDGSSMAVGIRFLADGTVEETSPDQIRIYEDPTRRPELNNSRSGRDQNEVWITTDAYRLRYEIATNTPLAVRR